VTHLLSDAIRRINAKKPGKILIAVVVGPATVDDLTERARAGDIEARRAMKIGAEVIERIESAPPCGRAVCGACARELRGGRYSVAILPASPDDLEKATAVGICFECGIDHAVVKRLAMQAFQGIWPELREISVVQGGKS
jgi:heterodisulfide reductase subunit A-like polyferredoxin